MFKMSSSSQRDDQIRITHYVNPHVFYFKYKKDCEEFDEELEEIERKITNIAKAATNVAAKQTNNASDNVVVSKTVGYFVSDWNKWIRCVVKAKDTNGAFYLWAQDYGVPFVAKRSHIIEIPLSFQGMSIKRKVHLGGLIDCVPAEQYFDIFTGSVEMKMSKNWSTNASERLGEILKSTLALEFKDIQLHHPMTKPHYFGRLMIQLENGSWHNATKCLLTLNCATVSHDHWGDVLRKHDSCHQDIWRKKDGTPLSYKTSVIPIKCNAIIEEADDVEKALDVRLEADQNVDGVPIDCLSRIEIDELTLEDQRILDTSASQIYINRRNENSGGKRSQNNRKWVDPNSKTKNRNRLSNQPNSELTTKINSSCSNTSRTSNESGGHNRNANLFRRNDNNRNNNSSRPENRPDNRRVGSDGLFRPMENNYQDRNGDNNQQRQFRTPRLNSNRSGQFEPRKSPRHSFHTFGRLEKINENPSGVRENIQHQATENQNKNVKKPVEKQDENVENSVKKKNREISEVNQPIKCTNGRACDE